MINKWKIATLCISVLYIISAAVVIATNNSAPAKIKKESISSSIYTPTAIPSTRTECERNFVKPSSPNEKSLYEGSKDGRPTIVLASEIAKISCPQRIFIDPDSTLTELDDYYTSNARLYLSTIYVDNNGAITNKIIQVDRKSTDGKVIWKQTRTKEKEYDGNARVVRVANDHYALALIPNCSQCEPISSETIVINIDTTKAVSLGSIDWNNVLFDLENSYIHYKKMKDSVINCIPDEENQGYGCNQGKMNTSAPSGDVLKTRLP